jgi:Ca2+-transporting ATPase
MFQLFHVMAIRSSEPFYRVSLWSNYRLTVAVALGVILQFAVVYVPQLQRYFHTVPLTFVDAAIAVTVSSLIFIVIELWKQLRLRGWVSH